MSASKQGSAGTATRALRFRALCLVHGNAFVELVSDGFHGCANRRCREGDMSARDAALVRSCNVGEVEGAGAPVQLTALVMAMMRPASTIAVLKYHFVCETSWLSVSRVAFSSAISGALASVTFIAMYPSSYSTTACASSFPTLTPRSARNDVTCIPMITSFVLTTRPRSHVACRCPDPFAAAQRASGGSDFRGTRKLGGPPRLYAYDGQCGRAGIQETEEVWLIQVSIACCGDKSR